MMSSRKAVTIMLWVLLFAAGIAQPAMRAAQAQPRPGPYVSRPATPGRSPAVRSLAVSPQPDVSAGTVASRQQRLPVAGDLPGEQHDDPFVAASRAGAVSSPAATVSFDGIGATGFVPPDTAGAVGPNHFVQMVNAKFAIYNKSGTQLQAPTNINQLWVSANSGDRCKNTNSGDPSIVYDGQADRWLLSQFVSSAPYAVCVAISQSADPTGAYYLYEFAVDVFPDYLKFAVWPDGYYMSSNDQAPVQGTPLTGVYAFDRARMLNGQAATYQKFQVQRNFMLPSNLDGPTPPPAGTPNLFYTIMDDTYWPSVGFPGVDRLEIWEYHVDWATPANSTFAKTQELPTSFNYLICGFFIFDCVPQQGTGQKVDALAEYPMWRFVYRNFGIHQSLVGNFTVKVTEPDRTGIRWFELRKTSGGWSIAQQGTHAPDSHYRWMGSAAMDRSGNLALGYSVSSSSLNPAIRYATRAYSETLGTLQNEASLQEGAGVQTGSNRWGDYSAMTVDPVDDCTFWFTSEYYAATSSRSWSTRIGAFKLPSCGISQLAVVNTPDDAAPLPGQQVTLTITISNTSLIDATNAALELVLPAGLAPAGPATLVPPAAGTLGALPGIVSNLNVPAGQVVTLSLPVKVSIGLAPATKLISTATLSGTNLAASASASTITVGDAAPIAADDSATTPRETPVRISVLANDVDLNGRSLSIDAVDLPGHGTAIISGTDIVYSPAPGFGGSDQFTYVVSDGTLFGVATVYVDVMPKDQRVYLPLVRR